MIVADHPNWLRGQDLNLRPSGYEPDELPGCSTPRRGLTRAFLCACANDPCCLAFVGQVTWMICEWVFVFLRCAPASMPGDDLLFQRLSVSTIGAVRFHGRVRDGIGWGTDAMVTKQWSRRVSQKGLSMLFFQMFDPAGQPSNR